MAQDRIIILPLSVVSKKDYDGSDATAQLECRTYKSDNGQIVSSAHVSWRNGRGFTTTEIFGDYSKVFSRTRERGTQKNIDHQHAIAFSPNNLQSIKLQVIEFYAAKNTEEAKQKERDRRDMANGLGSAVAELMAEGIDASTALRMCNVD